jgi:hypothetical protein
VNITLQSIFSRPSAFVLILANLVPLIGLLFFNWQLPSIMLIYWTEGISVGFFNILKMIMIGTHKNELMLSIFTIPFFVIHYGLFTAVQGLLIVALFGIPKTAVVLPATFLFLSHGYSFLDNFMFKNAYEKRKLMTQMFVPYKRMVLQQSIVILGGLAVLWLGTPTIAIVILIIAKMTIDTLAHSGEHSAQFI